MRESVLIRVLFFFLGLILIFYSEAVQAVEFGSSFDEIQPGERFEAPKPKQMTQKQMNDLFGEDPYLGQTSYLQSPDGFNQREKSK